MRYPLGHCFECGEPLRFAVCLNCRDLEGLGGSVPPEFHFPVYAIAFDEDVKHSSPLCPDLDGAYWMADAEDALYAVGERHCKTCHMHSVDVGDSWTDPRYRRGETA